ncbi:MAG: helix-turn-helix transcriptional regulator [Henriciella sp.]|nr:helix-turn-helix transcriptional regulator [Henriciella sp.]
MSEASTFTVEELSRLSREASGPRGGLEIINEAHKFNDIQFEGVARSFPMRSGLSMLYTNLTTKETFEMDGEIDASLNIVVMSGPGTVGVQFGSGECQQITTNQAFVLAVKDKARLYGRYKKGQTNSVVRLRLFADLLEDQALASVVRDYCEAPRVIQFPFFSETSSMFPLIQEPIGGSLAGQFAAESIAFDLIARLVLTQEAGPGGPSTDHLLAADRRKLLRVRDQIVSVPSADYNLEELAAVAGMGVSALKEKFPLLFGRPVITFLRDVRLDRAREALEIRNMTVAEASRLAGYKHLSTFSAAFRKRFGKPPSAFLKKRPNP